MSEASKLIRDSIAALPENERLHPWQAGRAYDYPERWWVGAGGMTVADAGRGAAGEQTAEHIALLASPHVAAAVADPLDALGPASLLTATAEQLAARNALEAAITRTGDA